jgi:SET domain-containing protein
MEKKFKNIVRNKPVAPVKFKKDYDKEVCICSPHEDEPCGEGSDCMMRLLKFECGKNCPAGEKCQNNKVRLRKYAEIELKKTGEHGFGAFAKADIPAGTLIIEYTGEVISKAEMMRRFGVKKARNDKAYYFMSLDAELYIDAEHYGNKSRFINHSCNANSDTFKITVENNTRIAIFSKVHIPAVS